MLQSVATLVSLMIAAGALAVIVNVLADDWRLVVRALGFGRSFDAKPVFAAARPRGDRRARVVRVSPQSAPQRAAA
jgi:hypothetical protein